MSIRALAIDDDRELIDLLTEYIAQHGIELDRAFDGPSGIAKLNDGAFDVVILDVMLPHMNGFEVCREIRKTSSVPIIMLSARGDVKDRILGLEIGADDYMPKPFEPRELVVRIQTVLRRSPQAARSETKLVFGDLKIDLERHTAELKDKMVNLTSAEFSILSLFVSQPQIILNRDQITDHLQGTDWNVYSRSVDVLMSRLRQKLNDDPKQPRYFKTVWGQGYMFIG